MPNMDEYYDEEDVSPEQIQAVSERSGRNPNGRQLSQEEEEMILGELMYSAQDNKEFMKVLHILQNDGELRPLIFEHEALLRTLKDMRELKAEQMLSILTAAETEMYESSKKNEELIQQQKQGNKAPTPETKELEAKIVEKDHETARLTKDNE